MLYSVYSIASQNPSSNYNDQGWLGAHSDHRVAPAAPQRYALAARQPTLVQELRLDTWAYLNMSSTISDGLLNDISDHSKIEKDI